MIIRRIFGTKDEWIQIGETIKDICRGLKSIFHKSIKIRKMKKELKRRGIDWKDDWMLENKYVKAFEGARRMEPAMVAGMLVKHMKQLDKAKEFLRKIEWIYDGNHDKNACMLCDRFEIDGHKEDCELKILLDELHVK